ncbi:MAG: hypothetical protein ACE5F1_14965 [Planctomycetota bacterium]
MRRSLNLVFWIVLFLLAPLMTIAGPGEGRDMQERRVEERFVEEQILEPKEAGNGAPSGLAQAWFAFFLVPAAGETPLGAGLAVASAWLLIAVSLAVLVGGGSGLLPAACCLIVLALHPLVHGLGRLMTPWLPAMAFVLLSLAFLQGMALPTRIRRPRSPGRWSPRIIAALGSGLSLGLASTAEPSIAWIMLIPSVLFLLALLAAGLALFRIRSRLPLELLVQKPWAFFRRTLPWALCWFLVLLLLVEIHGLLGEPPDQAELARLVATVGFPERLLAWASVPGLLLLTYREGQRLSFRSRLAGSTVLFVSLVVFWLHGPALRADPDPLARLLGAPVFAACCSVWLRRGL